MMPQGCYLEFEFLVQGVQVLTVFLEALEHNAQNASNQAPQ